MWRVDWEDKTGSEGGKAGLVRCLTRGEHWQYLLNKWLLKQKIDQIQKLEVGRECMLAVIFL